MKKYTHFFLTTLGYLILSTLIFIFRIKIYYTYVVVITLITLFYLFLVYLCEREYVWIPTIGRKDKQKTPLCIYIRNFLGVILPTYAPLLFEFTRSKL